jgi:pimeloyl-ACP methyl ester carboxylesterase
MAGAERDPLVQNAVNNWAPRFVARGVDMNDFVRITSGIQRWDEWLDAWVAGGDFHMAIARAAEANGCKLTAGEAYVRAGLYYHFGKYLWLVDVEKYRATVRKSEQAVTHGLSLIDPTFERISIPFEGGTLFANLRRPQGSKRPPLVLLVPGLDSTKEEFPDWEREFLAREMATLSLDGPGQGESGFTTKIRPDYEVGVAAALDRLASRSDLDLTRVGIAGCSLGGYYAPRAAAFEPRIKAAIALGGPYARSFQATARHALTTLKMLYDLGFKSIEEAPQQPWSLQDALPKLNKPLLVVHSKDDWAFPAAGAERMAREAPQGELVMFEDGGHCCPTHSLETEPMMADWMKKKLG